MIVNSPATTTKEWRHLTLLLSQPQWWANRFFFPLGTHRNIFMFILLLLMYLFSYIVYNFAPPNCSDKSLRISSEYWAEIYLYRWKKGTEEQKADILSFKTSIYQPPTQKAWFSEEKSWAPGLPFVTITMKNWRGLTCPSRDWIEFRSSGACKPSTAGASASQLLSRDASGKDSPVRLETISFHPPLFLSKSFTPGRAGMKTKRIGKFYFLSVGLGFFFSTSLRFWLRKQFWIL